MKKLKLVMVGDGMAGVRTLEDLLRIAPDLCDITVACPLHNWRIDLRDGAAAAPDEGCTPKFALWVEGGQVNLDRAELAELGTRLPLPVAGPALRCQPA